MNHNSVPDGPIKCILGG